MSLQKKTETILGKDWTVTESCGESESIITDGIGEGTISNMVFSEYIAACLVAVGTTEEKIALVAAQSSFVRDRLMLNIYEAGFGENLALSAVCSECGEVEVPKKISELKAVEPDATNPVLVDGRELTFFPDSAEIEDAIEALPKGKTPLSRRVQFVNDSPGDPSAQVPCVNIDKWPSRRRIPVYEALKRFDGDSGMKFAEKCPSCGKTVIRIAVINNPRFFGLPTG